MRFRAVLVGVAIFLGSMVLLPFVPWGFIWLTPAVPFMVYVAWDEYRSYRNFKRSLEEMLRA